ncbi:hypothetical protein GCM10011609_64120 [Lentzea pudingi]|uniref:Uncharacterized protein n=1 Tax=Lentzea pudingi TaxID=1789439 RepID=A0ABQ2INE6_9PSEU|nr:hypothetical protein [Lentzea pudingi]GGN14718.1 hypothetical protein GCM10011609_64120 [Lentzea pudingi]
MGLTPVLGVWFPGTLSAVGEKTKRFAVGLYVLWGLLHAGLGISMVAGDLSNGVPAGETAAESLLYFIAVTVLGLQAIYVALTLVRANDPVGFWLNAVVLGVIDAAFVLYLVLPGHVDLFGGIAGPVIWLAATVCAALAQREGRLPRTGSAPLPDLGQASDCRTR